MYTVLHLTDHHWPFVDDTAIDLSKKALHMLQPDMVVFGGDLIDGYSISRFKKRSDKFYGLQTELDKALAYLAECRQLAPQAVFEFTPGNHEKRIYNYIDNNAPGIGTLRALALADLFDAEKFGMRVHQFRGGPRVGEILFTHGAMIRKNAGASAKAMAERYGCSIAMGHAHRLGCTPCTHGLEITYAYESGCLCSLTQDYVEVPPDWQNAFSLFVFYGKQRETHTWIPVSLHQPQPLLLLDAYSRKSTTRKRTSASSKGRSKTTKSTARKPVSRKRR